MGVMKTLAAYIFIIFKKDAKTQEKAAIFNKGINDIKEKI